MSAPAFELSSKDLERLKATIHKRMAALVGDPVGRALRSEAEIEMTEAKRRTPVDTGALRSTGHVIGPERVGGSWQVRLVFGGPAVSYAAAVHENLEAFHKVGQAKYLESVIVESKPHIVSRVFRRLTLAGKI